MPPIPTELMRHSKASRGATSGCEQSQQSNSLFDYLVGAGEQRRRDFKTERLRGFKVDHKLVLGRRLHRQVCWLLALEDAIDISGGAAVLVDQIGP